MCLPEGADHGGFFRVSGAGMSDEQDASSPAGADQSQADESQHDDHQAGTAAQEVASLPEFAKKLIRETRQEAASYRTKLQKLEDRDKSELQKAQDALASLQQERDDAQAALRSERAERRIAAAASKANAVRPDAIVRLVRDELEFGDDGLPSNLDAVISKARKEYPELFRLAAGGADGGAGGKSATPVDMNARIRAAAGIKSY